MIIKHLRDRLIPALADAGREIVENKEFFCASDVVLGRIASPLDRLHHRAGPPPPHVPTPGLGQSDRKDRAGKASCYPVSGRCRSETLVSWRQSYACRRLGNLVVGRRGGRKASRGHAPPSWGWGVHATRNSRRRRRTGERPTSRGRQGRISSKTSYEIQHSTLQAAPGSISLPPEDRTHPPPTKGERSGLRHRYRPSTPRTSCRPGFCCRALSAVRGRREHALFAPYFFCVASLDYTAVLHHTKVLVNPGPLTTLDPLSFPLPSFLSLLHLHCGKHLSFRLLYPRALIPVPIYPSFHEPAAF